jgi:hypothetical protein
LYNQRSYQNLFRESETSVGTAEPFVGAICAPYDAKLPKSLSAFNWFYVGNREEDKNRPKQLRYEVQVMGDIQTDEIQTIRDLIIECGVRNDRVDLQQGWRKDRWESKFDKLKSSLESHFVNSSNEFSTFWTMVEQELGKWDDESMPVEE